VAVSPDVQLSLTTNRDHIFYFSYLQPAPKGDVLNLWANADELATANGKIPLSKLFNSSY
jgi:hypothetical protein